MNENIIQKTFARCPGCGKHDFAIDHLTPAVGKAGEWLCEACGRYVQVTLLPDDGGHEIHLTGHVAERITVTLATKTVPPILFKLNAWKYHHSISDTPEEFLDHQRYHYEEHTCGINVVSNTHEIEFNGDSDPHELFELKSIVPGHLED